MFIVITGGSGSGKSEFAEKNALQLYNNFCSENLFYLATMMPFGNETIDKIQKHKKNEIWKRF